MYGKPVVSTNRAKPGSPKRMREVDTITLDTSKDVSDNAKLFRAMTEATGTMMEQLSKQMVEFEEMRNVADQKESIRLDRMEKEILSGQKHMEILEILNLSSNSHGKLTGKFDKTMEVLLDINGGHAKTVGQIKTQDQRLANLEKTGQETNNLLKQMKASQDNMNRTLDTIMKQSDCSRVKGWLDDHTKGLHSKFEGHGKKQDDLAKRIMDGTPDHATIMKGVHGLLNDHLTAHQSKVSAAIRNLPLPPDEKVLLQAVENMQEASLGQTLEAIKKLQSSVHGKIDDQGKRVNEICAVLDDMPNHGALMKGVHGLLGEHLNDHSGRVMSEISKLPLPPNEKIMLQAIENLEGSVLGATLEAIEGVKMSLGNHADSLDDLHSKMTGHERHFATLRDGMPDHDVIMKGVHGLLGEHLGDHGGKVMKEINKLPIPADEKIMLQAIENMEESVLTRMLEAIADVKKEVVGHADKLDGHGKAMENLCKNMDDMPDHDTLMKGVHGLLGDHLGDHSGQVMSEINKLPLPANEKVMLQAMENMEEQVLATILEAIEGVKKEVTSHAERLDGHADAMADMCKNFDSMPDHDQLMKGVHGLLGDHLGDHSGQVMSEINKLPLPANEKVMLQAMENMEESVLAAILEAIEGVKTQISAHADRLDSHGKGLDALLEGMPDQDALMKGVHGIVGDHLGDHSGAITNEINKLPLPADEKIMLQAMENMEESVLRATLEAIEGVKIDIYESVKGELDQHHITLSAHSEFIMEEMSRRQQNEQVMLGEIEGMLNNAIGGMAFVSAIGVKVSESQLGGNVEAPSRSTARAPPKALPAPAFSPPAREAAPTPAWLKDSSKKDAAAKDTTSKWASSRTSTRSEESSPTPSWLKDKDSAKSNVPARTGRASEVSSPAPSSRISRPSSTAPTGRAGATDGFSCKCGFNCGTETAMSRHLAKNTDRGHGRV